MILLIDEWAVREAMARARIRTVRELADRAGVSHTLMHNVLRGLAVSDETRAKVAGALAVDEGQLWRRRVE